MSLVPEKVTTYRVYTNGNDLVGTADVQLPKLAPMSDTVKGAGIAGEVDSPTVGHYQSMSLTINWRTLTSTCLSLAGQRAYDLDLRAAIQIFNAGSGTYVQTPLKVSIRGIPKSCDLGKLDIGSAGDASTELEVIYIKILIDGKTKVEIDKYNYIAIINGEDYLLAVRTALGLV